MPEHNSDERGFYRRQNFIKSSHSQGTSHNCDDQQNKLSLVFKFFILLVLLPHTLIFGYVSALLKLILKTRSLINCILTAHANTINNVWFESLKWPLCKNIFLISGDVGQPTYREMQQPERYIPSVSDLYGTDEIEFLLDEIRDLEPACCQLEDVQDFEIAGSRAGELSLSLESPIGTCTSWDSHAHYKHRIGQTPLPWGVALHCDPTHLKTPTGIVRILLVLSSAACLACECSAGTVQVGLFLLPLIGRLRLMVFCALFSLLITCLMLFLDVSHIALMFPFNWTKVNTWMYLSIGLIFILGSSLMLHMVLFAEAFAWVPKHTKDTLFTSAILGYICAAEALILSGLAMCPEKYRQVPDDASDIYVQDRELSPMSPIESTDVANHNLLQQQQPQHEQELQLQLQLQQQEQQSSQSDQQQQEHGESNHHNKYNRISSTCNQKPYIPAKRPDQSNNKRPTLGHTQTKKSNHRYREGYHYQPIASTSRQSPTFVLDDEIIGAGPSTSRSNGNSSA